jgi:guanylate kinase
MAKFDVFLSYSSTDKVRVRELSRALKSLGLRVFLDEEQLSVGDSLYATLSNALTASDYVVFCVSKASIASGWVEREVSGTLAAQVASKSKRLLPVLLEDARVPAVLRDLIWLDMEHDAPAVVATKIKAAIHPDQHPRLASYPRDVRAQVATALALLQGERPQEGFCWAIVSGPSSAGKDVLSYVASERLQPNYGLAFLRKITTRPRRPSEPSYVSQIDDAEFERKLRAGEIIFPFRKRGFRYGFDGAQFRESLGEGTPLLSVFTEFRVVPALVEAMNAAGAPSAAFFIETARADALRRVLFRNLPDKEVKARTTSIEGDYETMANRASFRQEYTFIPNSDSDAFATAAAQLTSAIESLIRATSSAPTQD